jgi:hypothetical protein
MVRNFYRCKACGHEWMDVWSATCEDDCPQCGARHMSPYESDDVDDPDKPGRIRELNDKLRTTFTGGKVFMTTGVAALPENVRADVLQRVRIFDRFDGANDPHREHDFGAFEIQGDRFFWKIDYYTPDFTGGSEDPSDPEQTTRVLTIMLATEY